jgi:hypothetical protein
MNSGSFWLADIGLDSLTVSLISHEHGYRVNSIGPDVFFDGLEKSLTLAIDESLSAVAEKSGVSPDQEPNTIALVIPPDWVGYDGKIITTKLKLFEEMFRELKLHPMGFISYDEALAEANNRAEGYPSSFVLAHFNAEKLSVSLVYLGKVVERIDKNIDSDNFDAQILESILLELKTESTLPPQIIISGVYSESTVQSIKSHPWIGRKDVETFLHLPDIKAYDRQKLIESYLDAVTSQFEGPIEKITKPEPIVEPEPELTEELVPPLNFSDQLVIDDDETVDESQISEVEPDELGFGPIEDNFSQVTALPVNSNLTDTPIVPPAPKVKINFRLPKINLSLPRIPRWSSTFMLIPLVISPLLVLIPFYFSRAEITLSLTPYTFSKSITATFDPSVSEVDLTKSIFPITSQTIDLTTSISTPATGQKTVGDQSTGEITIFNKLDKTISLPKGTVLVNKSGLKYELETSVQVASSSSNLSAGVINLGQTKAMVRASDIGQEYNLASESILLIKDYPETTAVAKVNTSLSGGSKRQVQAVGSSDKATLDSKLTAEINSTKEKHMSESTSKSVDMVTDLTQIKQGRVEYSREVGEEADKLSATVTTTITTYQFTDSQKSKIILAIFSSEPDFSQVKTNFNEFNLKITPAKGNNILPRGQATFSATFLPKTDIVALKKLVSGKMQSTAISLVKKNIPRVYNYQIKTNFEWLSFMNPLPFRTENIIINIK